jgi:hypothetical protein
MMIIIDDHPPIGKACRLISSNEVIMRFHLPLALVLAAPLILGADEVPETSVTADRMRAHVEFLAGDVLERARADMRSQHITSPAS